MGRLAAVAIAAARGTTNSRCVRVHGAVMFEGRTVGVVVPFRVRWSRYKADPLASSPMSPRIGRAFPRCPHAAPPLHPCGIERSMAKRTPTPRRPIVALDDLAPQRELRAGTGRRVFGADARRSLL